MRQGMQGMIVLFFGQSQMKVFLFRLHEEKRLRYASQLTQCVDKLSKVFFVLLFGLSW